MRRKKGSKWLAIAVLDHNGNTINSYQLDENEQHVMNFHRRARRDLKQFYLQAEKIDSNILSNHNFSQDNLINQTDESTLTPNLFPTQMALNFLIDNQNISFESQPNSLNFKKIDNINDKKKVDIIPKSVFIEEFSFDIPLYYPPSRHLNNINSDFSWSTTLVGDCY